MKKIGRNSPCPCGSGKKYKHCCAMGSNSINNDLQAFLLSQDFNSMEDAQEAADIYLQNQNQNPLDDFHGLSPEQVHQMLNFPFDIPQYVIFKDTLSIEPKAPILMLINGITSAIESEGLKATAATGSLPQKLCRQLWEEYKGYHDDKIYSSFHKVNKEDDFIELNVARLILELAGFIRKTKGRFYLTKKYQNIIKRVGMKVIIR